MTNTGTAYLPYQQRFDQVDQYNSFKSWWVTRTWWWCSSAKWCSHVSCYRNNISLKPQEYHTYFFITRKSLEILLRNLDFSHFALERRYAPTKEFTLSITPRYQNHASAFSKIIGPGLTWKLVSDPHTWTQPLISEIKFLALSDHDIMHVIQHYQLEPIGFVADVSRRKNQQERWSFRNVSTSSDSTRKEPRADMFREVRSVRTREFNDIPQISL